VPLKYAVLSYTEIWISESQERMVAAVPPEKVKQCLAIFAAEGVEAVDLGEVTDTGNLELFIHGEQVANVEMHFLHDGVPRLKRPAVFKAPKETDVTLKAEKDLSRTLIALMGRPNIASKEWVIRQYDHEVQAGSIVKPLVGVDHDGPSDAAVVAPRPGEDRGVAVACGLNTTYGDVDAYHSTAGNIEEALRNLVCVGAPIDQVAILDNFSWAKCTDPAVFGALVRACQACYDFALYYGTPFISGKDSLSNEFTYGKKVIKIPHTLLITAMTVVPDVTKSITMDVKRPGEAVVVVGVTRNELGGSEYLALIGKLTLGGKPQGIIPKVDRALSKPVLTGVAALTAAGLVSAAHDCSEGGLGAALAEMAFAGGYGMEIDATAIPREGVNTLDRALFSESHSRIVLTVPKANLHELHQRLASVPHAVIGSTVAAPVLSITGLGGVVATDLALLKEAWQAPLSVMAN
jgi:phosphoribosylformylglycinamidine synthase